MTYLASKMMLLLSFASPKRRAQEAPRGGESSLPTLDLSADGRGILTGDFEDD
jgi:hypothetical protein